MVSLSVAGAVRAVVRRTLAAPAAMAMNGRPVSTRVVVPGYHQPSVWLAIEYTPDLSQPEDAAAKQLKTLLTKESVCSILFPLTPCFWSIVLLKLAS